MTTFEPALYSRAELEFLRDHITESPTVALHRSVPSMVNPTAVREVLTAIFNARELAEVHQEPWCGHALILTSITRYLDWRDKCRSIEAAGGPRHPSMFAWDSTGRGQKYGIGSDAGTVRTEILEDGTRRRFAVAVHRAPEHADLGEIGPYVPSFARPRHTDPEPILVDESRGVVSCPVCGWATNYRKDSNSQKNLAMGRMSAHMKKTKEDVGLHRETWLHNYGAPDSVAGKVVQGRKKKATGKKVA